MSHQPYTLLGSLIWEWEPFISLDPVARCLWLGLYTTAEAKRVVPGLFIGSIHTMAEASKLPIDETMKALDKLLDKQMVEFDQKHRVLRLTMLPDGLESPPNQNVLLGWWKKFKGVPQCPVRDAHVATLRWIMDAWSRESGKPISDKHQLAWNDTFGTVTVVPTSRRRGIRRLQDDDTSTPVQPGLFDPPPVTSLQDAAAGENASTGGQTVPPVIGPTTDVPSSILFQTSQPIEKPIRGTVPERFANGSGNRSDQDQDQDLDLLFRKAEPSSGLEPPEDRDRESRPRLMLVPMPVPESELPFTTEQFLERLAAQSGQAFRPIIIRQTAQDALCATIRALTDAGVGDPEIALVAIWLAKNGLPITTDSAQRWYRLCDWATDPQNILAALAAAKEHERKSAEAVAELVEFKKQLGYPT